MRKIIQIDEYEYSELAEKAKLNEEDIKQRALKLHEKEKNVTVRIEYAVEQEYQGSFKLETCVSGGDAYNDRAMLSIEDRRNIVKQAKRTAKRLMERSVQKHLHGMNSIEECEVAMRKQRQLFVIITLTGWLLALGVLLVTALI